MDPLFPLSWQTWLTMGICLLILELIFSSELFLICGAIGAFCTAVVAYYTPSIIWQGLAFALFVECSILLVRPRIIKKLHVGNGRKSNVEALIGRTCTVTESITAGQYGTVQVDGDFWRAIAKEEIIAGEQVRITKQDGVTLTVEKDR